MSPAQAVGSATGAPKQAPTQKQQSGGFIPWSSFVSANKEVSDREAGKLAGQTQRDVDTAQGELSKAQQGFDSTIGGNYQQAATPATAPTKKQPASHQAPGNTPQAEKPMGRPESTAAAPGLGSETASGEQKAASLTGYTPDLSQTRQTTPSGEAVKATAPSPWASFAKPENMSPAGAPPKGAMQAPASNPLAGYVRSTQLTPGAVANGPGGPQDLEHSAGQQAWGQLLGDTTKAQEEANALGSQSGVEALLQSQQAAPGNSAFDAMLINGAGGPQFQKLSQQYGNGKLVGNVANAEQASQDAWKQLSGDVDTARAFNAAAAGAQPSSTAAATPAAAAPPSAADASAWSEQDQNGWNAAEQLGQQQAQKHGGQAAWDFTGGANDDSVDDNGVIHVPRKQQGGKFSADWSSWWGGGSDVDPRTMGLSAADLYALANVSPEQRAKWLKTHKHGDTNG